MPAPMGQSPHLATVRHGQARSRLQQNQQDAPFHMAQMAQRAAGEMHNAEVQAARRVMSPALEAYRNSMAIRQQQGDPRVLQVLAGHLNRASDLTGGSGARQALAELGAQAAGGVLPIG